MRTERFTLKGKIFKQTLLAAGLLSLPVIFMSGLNGFGHCLSSFSACAAEDSGEPSALQGRETRKTPAMRQNVYKMLSRVRELADAGKQAEANAALDKLIAGDLNSYERAMSYDLKGYMAFKNDDINGAIAAYQKIVALEDLPLSLELNSLYSLTKLAMMQERYADAEKALDRWFKINENPSGEAYILRAQLLYQAEKYGKAETALESALSWGRKNMDVMPENWLLLARAIYFNQKRQKKLAAIYDELILTYPKPEYWVQAASIYSELGNEDRQLALLETGYDKKALKQENEFVLLAQMLMANGSPYKGAMILTNEIKAGNVKDTPEQARRLADAWYLAKEYDKAIDAMNKALGGDKNGELYYRLAQMYFDADNYAKSAANARTAISKADKSSRYDRQVLLGLALYNQDDLSGALEAFRAAVQTWDPEIHRGQNIAPKWVQHLENEIKRQEALSQQSE